MEGCVFADVVLYESINPLHSVFKEDNIQCRVDDLPNHYRSENKGCKLSYFPYISLYISLSLYISPYIYLITKVIRVSKLCERKKDQQRDDSSDLICMHQADWRPTRNNYKSKWYVQNQWIKQCWSSNSFSSSF